MEFPPHGLSLRWFSRFLADDSFMAALALSLRVAVVTTVAVTVIGGMAALAVRAVSGAWRRWLHLGLLLPLVLPSC